MNEKELFEQGCFLPDWATDDAETERITQAYTRQSKDLPTLLEELDDIKEKIQAIQEKQWFLARKIYYHDHGFVQ